MPTSPIQKSDITKLLPITVKLLGIADANFPEGGQIAAGAPYTSAQIKEFIFQSDYEIALLIANNLEHPFRSAFPVIETDYLADGSRIPAHISLHSRVILKYGDQEFLGRQRDFQRIKRIKNNPAIYGYPVDLYAIFAGRIYFSEDRVTGKIDIPQIVKDLTLTNLLSPLAYAYAIIAGAVVKAAMPGFSPVHRSYWANLWTMYVREISGGAVALPETEQLERLGT